MRNILILVATLISLSCQSQFIWHNGGIFRKPANVDSIGVIFTSLTSWPTNWNRVTGTTTVNNLVYKTTGSNSGASVTLSQQTGVSINGTTYCDPPAYLEQDMYERVSTGNNGRTVSFASLPNGTYTVQYMGSRDATGTLNNSMTINGNTSGNHNIIDNCSLYSELTGVVVSSNTMTITLNSSGVTYVCSILLIKTG